MVLTKYCALGSAAIVALVFGGSICHAEVTSGAAPPIAPDAKAAFSADHEEGLTGPLPNLAVPAKDFGQERKYVIFHKPSASTEQVESDLRFCWRFLPHGVARFTPSFVPWGKSDTAQPVDYSLGGMYGLVGMGIGAIIQGPLERSIRQLRFFSCMLPRGYSRYRTSEVVWNRLNDDDHPERSILLQARVAAGPVPPTDKVVN